MKRGMAVCAVALAAWMAFDFLGPGRHSIRDFSGHEAGALETDMWRAYYGHNPAGLFVKLVETLREQYHVPFWPSVAGAYYASKAAVVFQRGKNGGDYEMALPDIQRYYRIIRRGSDVAFDADQVAQIELEWWIVHRERDRHSPEDLVNALAELQARIYHLPPREFQTHAKARAEAMLIRDTRAEAGGVTEDDWRKIAKLLDTSWTSAQAAAARR